MAKKPKPQAGGDPNSRIICRNRKARHEYDILEELECGVILQGSEVKSIRNNQVSLEEAYARLRNGELWLLGCDIAEYPQATVMNHERKQPRKLLLKKKELRQLEEATAVKGLTLIPLTMHFRRGFVKINLATARGRKLHDKRQKLRRTEDQRDIRSARMHRT
ncbi:MAG: SsrA-binding protein SmpB [Planctomycetaceae bacterium]|nr:SsrA-binding protein SmpB [Planctomycetaceae bacterium]